MKRTRLFDVTGKELTFSEIEKILNLSYFDSIRRVEVIDEYGRNYVNKSPNNNVSISVQDDEQTLKIFIDKTPSRL